MGPGQVLVKFAADACSLLSQADEPRADRLERHSPEAVAAAQTWVSTALGEFSAEPACPGPSFAEQDFEQVNDGMDALLDAVHAYVDAGGDVDALRQELVQRTR
jgi:hypothetical protein